MNMANLSSLYPWSTGRFSRVSFYATDTKFHPEPFASYYDSMGGECIELQILDVANELIASEYASEAFKSTLSDELNRSLRPEVISELRKRLTEKDTPCYLSIEIACCLAKLDVALLNTDTAKVHPSHTDECPIPERS